MEAQQQPVAALLQSLAGRSVTLGHQWTTRTELARVFADSLSEDVSRDTSAPAQYESTQGAERLIRAVLDAATQGLHEQRLLARMGFAIGAAAHRGVMSLHLMLKEIDLLNTLLLQEAEGIALEQGVNGNSYDGLRTANHIAEAIAQLRLAAVSGYTQAMSDELRERYRAIRHNLRDPLGTIKSAVALLTDETLPAQMRESSRVRAMVVRNTTSLDRLIDEVLGDTAAELRAFEVPRELVIERFSERMPSSTREESDDITRPRERPDSQSSTF